MNIEKIKDYIAIGVMAVIFFGIGYATGYFINLKMVVTFSVIGLIFWSAWRVGIII